MDMKGIHTIVFTGPESSGKSTLAEWLSREYDLPIVPEYAREYLSEKSNYIEEDVHEIAKGQKSREVAARAKYPRIICDTDLLTIKIWLQVKYGKDLTTTVDTVGKLYVLCVPDIPWEPDPLREDEHNRAALYRIYEEELLDNNAMFVKVYGSLENRKLWIRSAMEQIISVSSF